MMVMTRLVAAVAVGLIVGLRSIAFAQPAPPAGGAPLRLADLQRAARNADARAREIELLASQTELRLHNIDIERLPAVSAAGQSQLQSDVPTAPFTLPNGAPAFAPPKFTYDASVRIDQRIVDPSIGPRRALAHADLAESQARVRTSLFALRQEVNDNFFAAAVLQEQFGALRASIDDLEARLRETSVRVREGVALPAEAAAVEAALLRNRQQADEVKAARTAALQRLATLTGTAIAADAATILPDLADAAAQARAAIDRIRARPEYEQFDRARDRVARQEDVTAAGERVQLSTFGRFGYGRPGLNFISDQAEPYALAGIQLQWKAWTWGASARERQALALQRAVVAAEESAFTTSIRRALQTDLATIDRLQDAAASDDRIIALREDIDRTARVRLQEGATTAAEYVDRRTEWLTAQFDRARHRVELAQARARLLTTLGLEVP